MPLARIALYVVALAALGLTARGLFEPIAGMWSALALLVLLLLVLLGYCFPQWEMFTDLLVDGPRGASGAVLTFDDLPSDESLDPVLGLLSEWTVSATFFVPLSRLTEADAPRLRRLAAAGQRLALLGPEVRGSGALAQRLAAGFDELAARCGSAELIVRAIRPPRRLSVRLLGRAMEGLGAVLVAASFGWPEDPKSHQLRENLAPGVLLRIPASMLASDPQLLRKVLQAAEGKGVAWVPLEAWLD